MISIEYASMPGHVQVELHAKTTVRVSCDDSSLVLGRTTEASWLTIYLKVSSATYLTMLTYATSRIM